MPRVVSYRRVLVSFYLAAWELGADWLTSGFRDCAWRGSVVFADAVPSVEAAQRRGCPPVRVADQPHHRRDEYHPHGSGVEDEGHDHADAEHLDEGAPQGPEQGRPRRNLRLPARQALPQLPGIRPCPA